MERFVYGMFNGKIYLLKTEGVDNILSNKNFHYLKNLTEEDNNKYLWLPTEQLVAVPHITTVEDQDGRTWVQNQTLLIKIHDYLQLTNPHLLLSKFFLSLTNELPENFDPIIVNLPTPPLHLKPLEVQK